MNLIGKMELKGSRRISQANSQNISVDDLLIGVDGAESTFDVHFEGESSKKNDGDQGLVDSRPKKLTGVELIRENMKELNEVIGYMDFSFECAFTIQEKEFMLAYKVSKLLQATTTSDLSSITPMKYKMTSIN